MHLFSAIQLSLMSALSRSEQELTTDLNLSDNKMVELGQGGPRQWRVRPSGPLWHSLILFAQSSSSSVLSLARGPVESMASAPGNMCQNCYPSAAHPIHHGRRRRRKEEGVTCRSDGLRGVPTMGHSFAKCCGSHSRKIGHSPPSSSTHKCGIFSSRSMHSRCCAAKRSLY